MLCSFRFNILLKKFSVFFSSVVDLSSCILHRLNGRIFFIIIIIVIIIIIIIIYSLRVLHISVSWWSFIGVWETASLIKSPGLFSVFWPISIMQ